jgi:hypothetical protein
MPFDQCLLPEQGVAVFRARAPFGDEDLLAYSRIVTASERPLMGLERVLDLRALEEVAFTGEGVLRLVEIERGCVWPHRWGDVLIVASNENVLGMAGMYQLLAQGQPYQVRIFRDLAALRHHLGRSIDDPSLFAQRSA